MKTKSCLLALAVLALASPVLAQTTSVLTPAPIIGAGLASSARAYSPVADGLSGLPGFQTATSLTNPRKVCVVNLGVQSQGRVAIVNNRVNAQNLRVQCR